MTERGQERHGGGEMSTTLASKRDREQGVGNVAVVAVSSVVAEARRRRASRSDVVVADREWGVTMSARSVTVASDSRAEHCRRH